VLKPRKAGLGRSLASLPDRGNNPKTGHVARLHNIIGSLEISTYTIA